MRLVKDKASITRSLQCQNIRQEAENATIKMEYNQQSTDMESTAVEATEQTYVELPKKRCSSYFQPDITRASQCFVLRCSGYLMVHQVGWMCGLMDVGKSQEICLSHNMAVHLRGDSLRRYDQVVVDQCTLQLRLLLKGHQWNLVRPRFLWLRKERWQCPLWTLILLS